MDGQLTHSNMFHGTFTGFEKNWKRFIENSSSSNVTCREFPQRTFCSLYSQNSTKHTKVLLTPALGRHSSRPRLYNCVTLLIEQKKLIRRLLKLWLQGARPGSLSRRPLGFKMFSLNSRGRS